MCRWQYISMLLWIFGLKEDFVKGEALSLPFFLPALDPPLGISGRNRYKNGSIQSKAFCLWSSLCFLLVLPWIHPRADLIKALTHVRAMRTSSLPSFINIQANESLLLRSADKVGRPFCFCSVSYYFFKVCRQSRKTFLFLFCFLLFFLFFLFFLYRHLRLSISPLFLNQSRWNLACW